MAFLFDLSLDQESLTYLTKEALNKELKKKGSGVYSLNKFQKEKEFFLNHQNISFKIAKEKWGGIFHFESTFDLILSHHERLEGGGFPRNSNFHELSDIEKVICFVSNMDEKIETKYRKEDGSEYFKYLIKRPDMDQRLAQIIERSFDLADDDRGYHLQEVKQA